MKEFERIFWTTLAVAFVLLVHNGATPLFLIAYSLIPILILLFYYKKSLWPLSLYLLIFGFLGRYTRYFRQNYASDVLLVTRDFVGYLLAGISPYQTQVYSAKGLTPFIYLPFEPLWYFPAQIMDIDLRFFEMIIACLVPVTIFLYLRLIKKWTGLPLLAVVSLTPFLLDLSADGSNDNSAIFLLLVSILLLIYSIKAKKRKLSLLSAIVLGLALSFKHYVWFYFIFLAAFLWQKKKWLPINSKKYLLLSLIPLGFFLILFVSSPCAFIKSLDYIESRPGHPLWGWNLWKALEKHFVFSIEKIRLLRLFSTLAAVLASIKLIKINKFSKIFVGTSLSLLVYLILSPWTTYAYFTFLIPLMALAAIEIEN